MTKRALIVVDVQNDFLPGGALAVTDGDAVIPVVNDLVPRFETVAATRDYHPPGHESFASQHEGHAVGEVIDLHGLTQVLWPDHCVQGTPGADFADAVELGDARVFPKGTDPTVDSYSGFHDNGHRKSTGLGEWLKAQGVTDVYVLGLATDYCVKFTALDAKSEGFETYLVEDGCRGVELAEGDCAAALAEMREAGVRIVSSDEVTAA